MKFGLKESPWLCLALFAAMSQAGAANLCAVTDTRTSCLRKYEERLTNAAKETSAKVAETNKGAAEQSGQTNTGLSNAVSALPTSSFTDFFNTLNATANSGGANNDDPQALAFELNHCGFPTLPGQSLRCQVRARAEQPDIYDSVKTALQGIGLSDRATQIDDGLSVGDKATGGLFLSWVNDRFGRELTPGHNRLFQDLQDEADQMLPEASTKLHGANAGFAEFLQAVVLERMTFQESNEIEEAKEAEEAAKQAERAAFLSELVSESFTFDKFPDNLEQEVLDKFEELAAAQVTYADQRMKALQGTHYFQLANLLNNQPQPQIGMEYAAVTELAGPDEFRAKVSIEGGWVNINSFRKYQKNDCSKDGADTSTAICLSRYLAAPGVQQALETSARWAATVEYVRRKRYNTVVPDTTVNVTEKSVRSWIGSLSWGRYLDPFQAVSQLTRLDVIASYEDVSNDPKRQDRGIATATLSRQLSREWVLAVGLVYATKPEFRGAADKDLSLRLGLNYKILRNPAQ